MNMNSGSNINKHKPKSIERFTKSSLIAMGLIGSTMSTPAMAGTKTAEVDQLNAGAKVEVSKNIVIKNPQINGSVDLSSKKFNFDIPLSKANPADKNKLEIITGVNSDNLNLSVDYTEPNSSINAKATITDKNTTLDSNLAGSFSIGKDVKVDAKANLVIGNDREASNTVELNAVTSDGKVKLNAMADNVNTAANLTYSDGEKGLKAGVKYSTADQTVVTEVGYGLNQKNKITFTDIKGIGENTNNEFLGSLQTNLGDPKLNIDAKYSTADQAVITNASYKINKGNEINFTDNRGTGENTYNQFSGSLQTNLGDPKLKLNVGLETNSQIDGTRVSVGASYQPSQDTIINVSKSGKQESVSINYAINQDKPGRLTTDQIKKQIDEAISNRKTEQQLKTLKISIPANLG
jgi:hypothetical protein